MTLPYTIRLLCICLASFFLVHLAAGLAAAALAQRAVRFAERLRPNAAARLIMWMRLAPSALGLLAVGLLCIPSYLWFEPETAPEEVGLLCLLAAVLGLGLCGNALARGIRAFVGSLRTARRHARQGLELEPSVLVLEGSTRFFALAGILRPQIVVSRAVVRALSPEQFAAALRHERAHLAAHDNLKRLLLLAAPGLMPFFRGLGTLDRQWSRFAEFAADDRAVAGDQRRSLLLAAALVRVARLGRGLPPGTLAVSLIAPGCDLAERVDRLLHAAPCLQQQRRSRTFAAWAAAAAAAVALLLAPATLHSVHTLLESLVH